MGSYDEPIYDPFGERGPTHYHPANQAAVHSVALQLIFRDILRLRRLHRRVKDGYTKKLICKYEIIELVSLDQHASILANLILSSRIEYKIDQQGLLDTKQLYKAYRVAGKPYWRQLQTVRDKLAAHRDTLDLLTVSNLWDDIDNKAVDRILRTFVPLLQLLMKLNIYTWTKSHRDGTFSFVQPLGDLQFESS